MKTEQDIKTFSEECDDAYVKHIASTYPKLQAARILAATNASNEKPAARVHVRRKKQNTMKTTILPEIYEATKREATSLLSYLQCDVRLPRIKRALYITADGLLFIIRKNASDKFTITFPKGTIPEDFRATP